MVLSIRSFIKQFMPSMFNNSSRWLTNKKKANDIIWSGNFNSWEEAQSHCTGYDAKNILEKCKESLLKVKNGEAVYERDSILFDEIQYSWGLLSGLQKAALENHSKLCVLDFGGSLGSSFYQNKTFLNNIKELQWCIIEQPHFVECGKINFENDQLKFYTTIEECLEVHEPNVLLISGVLQYLEKPYSWIEKFLLIKIPYIILDRTSFIEGTEDIITIQNVPDNIYNASYPSWFFTKNKFINEFTKRYTIIGHFDSGYTPPCFLNEKKIYWEGLILKR